MTKTFGAVLIVCSLAATPVLASGDWTGSISPQQNGTWTGIITNPLTGKTEVVGVYKTKGEARRASRNAKRLKNIQVDRVDPPETIEAEGNCDNTVVACD